MATKQPGKITEAMEYVVSRPPLATLTVGGSILILLYLIDQAALLWPVLTDLKYVMPFVPPFFITRTAKKINSRRAEMNFIADAEPLIYVGEPAADSLPELFETLPQAVSNSAERHLSLPLEKILNQPVLTPEIFPEETRREVFSRLLAAETSAERRRAVRNMNIEGNINGKSVPFLLNAVLKPQNGEWKLQLTLIPLN